MTVLAAVASAEASTTFPTVMEHVAEGFEALGAVVLIVGVFWSLVLAVIVWRRSGKGSRVYAVLRQTFGGALLLSL